MGCTLKHLCWAGALLCISRFARADDQAYKICLRHPVEVGQRYSIWADVKTTSTVESKQPGLYPTKTYQSSDSLDASEKILRVEPNTNSPCKVEITLKSLIQDGNPLLPAGTVVVLENLGNESGRCTIEGEPADDVVAAALRSLVPLQAANNPHSNDELMGTTEPQKIGASWTGNSAQLAHRYTGGKLTVGENDIKGTAKLLSAEAGPHGETLHVKFKIDLSNTHGDWVKNERITGGTISEETDSVFSNDPDNHRADIHSKTTVVRETTTRGDDGKTADFITHSERTYHWKVEPGPEPAQ